VVTISALSRFHGNQAGQWLDDLEAEFVNNVKNSHTEGLPMESEFAIVEHAGSTPEYAGFRNMVAELTCRVRQPSQPAEQIEAIAREIRLLL
jgi:hypothetical protein